MLKDSQELRVIVAAVLVHVYFKNDLFLNGSEAKGPIIRLLEKQGFCVLKDSILDNLGNWKKICFCLKLSATWDSINWSAGLNLPPVATGPRGHRI